MRIEDFPRPKDDNGRGLHWSASPYHLSGSELDYWLDELQAMGIKWVKVLDDGGGSSLELCRRLSDLGIMPVVRLYIGNPGHVQTRNLEAIRRLIDVGVFYFETNNEPDLAIEWPDGVVPRNWLEIVVDNFIIDATEIIALGGYPAFPAMGVGTIVNPFQLIVARGRQDLFDNGAWLAIHNYVLNHPLDYPYDAVNQTGQPLTQEEYEANRWGWDNDKLVVINRLRREGAKPGATIRDDATCWLAYVLWNEQVVEAFGHSVPIMSTEGGVVVGDRQDGRYPRNDVRRHEEVTLWIQDFLLSGAPSWYFTVFHWLIANNQMGQYRRGWETQCWYTHWWDAEFGLNGQLPTVDALKRTPSRIRHDARADAVISGQVTQPGSLSGAPGRIVTAWKNERLIRQTTSRADGSYRLVGLPPGVYAITVDGVLGALAYGLNLASHSHITQPLPLPAPKSAIGGRVYDPSGAPRAVQTVALYQDGRRIASTTTNRQGQYAFGPLAASAYQVGAVGLAPQTAEVDGRNPVTVNLVVPADWKYEFRLVTKRLLPQSESRGRHAFFGVVRDEVGGPIDGVKIEMSWTGALPGTRFPTTLSGSDPGKPRGYFEFVHTRGEFQLRLLDTPWAAQPADGLKTAGLPGQLPDESVSYEVNWQLCRVDGAPAQSVVTGTVIGGVVGLRVCLSAGEFVVSKPMLADGSFRFDNLPAGVYQLELEGVGVVARDIVLDGLSAVDLLPIDISDHRQGAITGTISDLQGAPWVGVNVRLWQRQREIGATTTDAAGRYRFEQLLPGIYAVETIEPPAHSSDVLVDGRETRTIDLLIPRPPAAPKTISHYVLFGRPGVRGGKANYRAARRYIIAAGLAAGFDAGEAAHAERVTIIGDDSLVSREVEDRLRQAGCVVGRVAGDTYAIAEQLAALTEQLSAVSHQLPT